MLEQKQSIIWTCDICGEKIEQEEITPEGSDLLTPSLPFGWNKINGRHICSKHNIKILIDNKEMQQLFVYYEPPRGDFYENKAPDVPKPAGPLDKPKGS